MMLVVIGVVIYLIVGVLIIRNTIGPGLGIAIGDGINVAWLYIAIVFWPFALVYYFYCLWS